MSGRIQVDNYHGSYVEPFRRVTIRTKRAVCRFCLATAWKGKDRYSMSKPDRTALEKSCGIPVGTEALEMIVFSGPAGSGYVCLDCGRKLIENLQREVGG